MCIKKGKLMEASGEVTGKQTEQQQQLEADKMCRNMRIDCEDLLNARGIVKIRPGTLFIFEHGPFGKGKVLESSITDDKGERTKLNIFSTGEDPAKSSEIIIALPRIGVGEDWINKPFLSLKKDSGSIDVFRAGSRLEYPRLTRKATLKEANAWKKVVDAVKIQINQSSPIEHK